MRAMSLRSGPRAGARPTRKGLDQSANVPAQPLLLPGCFAFVPSRTFLLGKALADGPADPVSRTVDPLGARLVGRVAHVAERPTAEVRPCWIAKAAGYLLLAAS